MRKSLFRTGLAAIALLGLYLTLLAVPQPFFPFSVSAHNLVLYSDRPLPNEAAQRLLQVLQAPPMEEQVEAWIRQEAR